MPIQLDLNKLAGGALAEKVGIELQKIAANIADPNTKATAARTLTVKITLKPDEERSIAISDISCESKLVKANGVPAKFIIDMDEKGQAVMAELASGARGQLMIDHEGDLADDKGHKLQAEDNKKVVAFK